MIAWIRTVSNRMSIVRYCISHGKLVMRCPLPPNTPPQHTIIPVNYWSQAEMIDGTNIVFVNSPYVVWTLAIMILKVNIYRDISKLTFN